MKNENAEQPAQDDPDLQDKDPELVEQPAQQQEWIEAACALIKAADDAAADNDYMLDCDDCIKVLRGEWKGHLMNDQPTAPQPAQQFTEDAPADCKRLAEHGAPICGRCHMGPCKYTAPQAQPAREPLTDEQWQIIADTLGCIITREQKDAIEAAHGIKENT